jgi:hypothetical protein
MTEQGRFMELDRLIRKIAEYLIDVENPDDVVATSAKNICKLLYYTEPDPLSQPDQTRIAGNNPAPTFETTSETKEYIMQKRVLLVPKVPAMEERGSFIICIIDDFVPSPNEEFKPNSITFDVLCHNEDWLLENTLRPFVLMQQIDNIFNNRKMSVGNLKFSGCRSIVLTPSMLGYRLVYSNVAFN